MTDQNPEDGATHTATREALIDLCERGVVPENRWRNRDSSGAQRQLGEALALLRAGCAFRLASSPVSDANTWWVYITFAGFGHFDWGGPFDDELFYIPTAQRLEQRNGDDWY